MLSCASINQLNRGVGETMAKAPSKPSTAKPKAAAAAPAPKPATAAPAAAPAAARPALAAAAKPAESKGFLSGLMDMIFGKR